MDYKAQTEWKKRNTKFYGIRLNKNTDAGLIAHLDAKAKTEGVQGYLKRLIREDAEKA